MLPPGNFLVDFQEPDLTTLQAQDKDGEVGSWLMRKESGDGLPCKQPVLAFHQQQQAWTSSKREATAPSQRAHMQSALRPDLVFKSFVKNLLASFHASVAKSYIL